MQLNTLETPALVLDQHKMLSNIQRLRDRLDTFAVTLRPHVKTAKSLPVARAMLPGEGGGITVSTLKEAEYFFAEGIDDILYAVAVTPAKLAHVAELMRRGCQLKIILDSREAAAMVAAAGERHGVVFEALIEIDSDGHRAGLKPGDPAICEVGQMLEAGAGSRLLGVMTHAGGSYNSRSTDDIVRAAEAERRAVVGSAEALRAAGLPCPVVSVGSTPTAFFAESLEGVSEVRAGVYVFQDLVMAGLGVCRPAEIAISVLGCVIGHQREKNWIITDTGWMAVSRDRGTQGQAVDQGYGLVADEQGEIIGDLILQGANQEHGIIARRDGGAIDLARYPVGTYLRVLPNHACATAAQHGCYRVVQGGTDIVDTWQRINGW